MIASESSSPKPAAHEGVAPLVLPADSARFQCALYLELLGLAARVLKQYRREQLSGA